MENLDDEVRKQADETKEQVEEATESAVDPENSNHWIWTLIIGIVALALGGYILIWRDSASIYAGYAIAIFIAISGLIQMIGGYTRPAAAGAGTDRIRGWVGLIGGALIGLLAWFGLIGLSTGYTLLALLLIAYGGLGIFELLFDRGNESFKWVPLLVNALFILMGVLIFVFRSNELDLAFWVGLILAIIGLLIGAYALFIERGGDSSGAPV